MKFFYLKNLERSLCDSVFENKLITDLFNYGYLFQADYHTDGTYKGIEVKIYNSILLPDRFNVGIKRFVRFMPYAQNCETIIDPVAIAKGLANNKAIVDSIIEKYNSEKIAIISKEDPLDFPHWRTFKSFNLLDKCELNTHSTFISKAEFDYETKCLTQLHSCSYLNNCSEITQTSYDFEVSLPLFYLHYYGYNLKDLENWLEVIKEISPSFTYLIDYDPEDGPHGSEQAGKLPAFGDGELHTFNKFVKHKDYVCYGRSTFPIQTGYAFFPVNEKHRVRIIFTKNGTRNKYVNYFHFVLFRFIFSNYFWNIPAHVFLIKEALPEVSYLTALLLAYCKEPYRSYYGLGFTYHRRAEIDFNLESELVKIKNAFPIFVGNYINPFENNIEDLLKLISFNRSVSNVWKKVSYLGDPNVISEYFEKRDFKGLYEFFLKIKNNKIEQ